MQLTLSVFNTANVVTMPKVKRAAEWINVDLFLPIMTYDKEGNETGWRKITYHLEELDAIGLEYPIARITVENSEALDVEDIHYALIQHYTDHDVESLAIKNVFTNTWEFKTAIH